MLCDVRFRKHRKDVHMDVVASARAGLKKAQPLRNMSVFVHRNERSCQAAEDPYSCACAARWLLAIITSITAETGITMSISFRFSVSPVLSPFGCVIVDQSLEEAREALYGRNDRRIGDLAQGPPKRATVRECLRRYARSTPAIIDTSSHSVFMYPTCP